MIRRWFFLGFAFPCLAIKAVSPANPPASQATADPAYFKTGILTLQDRIWAQTQIERVWYNHRIWPKEIPGPKPPFEQLVPAAVIEKKAIDTLRMTAALKQFWSVEITPAMLQAELDRMERDSKDRATLHELFAALRDDPFLIAETIARQNAIQDLQKGSGGIDETLPTKSDSPTAKSDYYALPVPPIAITSNCDDWSPTSIGTNVPSGRYWHTATWTGSEMIVWGGRDGVSYLNTGGRYYPATDTWLPTSIGSNVPAVRRSHSAVWTGTEMIIWGGSQ